MFLRMDVSPDVNISPKILIFGPKPKEKKRQNKKALVEIYFLSSVAVCVSDYFLAIAWKTSL